MRSCALPAPVPSTKADSRGSWTTSVSSVTASRLPDRKDSQHGRAIPPLKFRMGG
jgi:hypothetical protein